MVLKRLGQCLAVIWVPFNRTLFRLLDFSSKQQAFLDFVLQHYINEGVSELAQDKLNPLLRLKYNGSIKDAVKDLGGEETTINKIFVGFQRYLYTAQPLRQQAAYLQ